MRSERIMKIQMPKSLITTTEMGGLKMKTEQFSNTQELVHSEEYYRPVPITIDKWRLKFYGQGNVRASDFVITVTEKAMAYNANPKFQFGTI